MKRAQIEIIGLVIVVIIIVIGALFYVKFGVLDSKEQEDKTSLEVSFVSNLLNSLLNVNICDGKSSMDEEIISCFESENWCGGRCDDSFKSEIDTIVGLVGSEKFEDYSLWVKKRNDEEYFNTGCVSGVKADTKVVGANKGVYTVNLQLC